jgi:hypothetical protein
MRLDAPLQNCIGENEIAFGQHVLDLELREHLSDKPLDTRAAFPLQDQRKFAADRWRATRKQSNRTKNGMAGQVCALIVVVTRWDEKAGLRRDAIGSQVIDAL